MNKQNAIEVRNMTKFFKIDHEKRNTLKERLLNFKNNNNVEVHTVLKDINMDISKGETVALIGTNGSGKSTLLKLMTKIIFPNKGTVETNGKLTSLLELGAGFHIEFTGRENIYFNASIFGLTRKEIDARIDDIIEFSELGEFIDSPVRTYSSGMYMRLAFSVAINVDADILLIDEILAVGDQHFQDKCFDKLRELKESGKTIVIVTHSLDVVKDLCTRAVWIYKGELRLDGAPNYVIEEYLKQVAIDHKEEKRQAILKGDESSKSIVFIDSPSDYQRFVESDSIHLHGWQLSDCEICRLAMSIDENNIDSFTRVPRPDVYQIYQESFMGFMDENTIGWNLDINAKDLSKGEHIFNVSCFDEKDKILAQKRIHFFID